MNKHNQSPRYCPRNQDKYPNKRLSNVRHENLDEAIKKKYHEDGALLSEKMDLPDGSILQRYYYKNGIIGYESTQQPDGSLMEVGRYEDGSLWYDRLTQNGQTIKREYLAVITTATTNFQPETPLQ